jgi:hypothetical protein
MIEIKGDIWSFWQAREWVVITTNGVVKRNGCAVMGKGIALQAAQRFPDLPKQLGIKIKEMGNYVFKFPDFRLYTFPTKHDWRNISDIKLIEDSCMQLKLLSYGMIYMPRPGCENGGLNWEQVKPVIQSILTEDRFVLVEYANIKCSS